jgi:hypothetical protein
MESLKEILKKRFKDKGPVRARYEFQEYGIRLAEELHDKGHKALYIKLAKERDRHLLESARIFATEFETPKANRGPLFMWKLKELEKEAKTKSKTRDG